MLETIAERLAASKVAGRVVWAAIGLYYLYVAIQMVAYYFNQPTY
ncbi:hypothetical protein [Spirosoma sordidisoli]|nr:hypothetical protein [Spirosoma sordidisoli]